MRFLFPLSLLLLSLLACKQTAPNGQEITTIKIARDGWGVPHIIAPTDAEVAYGLGWAQCEDDFKTLQEQMAACKGMLGAIKGKDGLVADFAVKFMGLSDLVAEKYDRTVTGGFRNYLEQYVAGINAYAALYPEEVLSDDLFPLKGQDIITGYLLGNMETSGAARDLKKILDGEIIKELKSNFPKGSNTIAIAPKKTTDGKTYLAINSHQPLEGWYSWYEAHLISEEGLNILGGTFPGGICIFHGVNEHLAWAHTVNHADFSDVYKLTMHPDKELHYRFDGEWIPLEEKKHWAWMKLLGPIKIPIRQVSYKSKYGPTFETEDGFFAWRFVVGRNLKLAEQWYRMNKAQSFEEFQNALKMRAIPSLNIGYADNKGNIYYLSNGTLPVRNENYQWGEVLPGDTSATLWQDDIIPFEDLPQILNPECGWIFNTNNTPFSASDSLDNFKETALNKTMGFLNTGLENNRSTRFLELIHQYDSLSYEDFKRIKFDRQYAKRLTSPYAVNLELLLQLNPDDYPDIRDAISLLAKWDRNTDIGNTIAPLYILSWMHLDENRKVKNNRVFRGSKITKEHCASAIRAAKSELLTNFGQLEIPLGNVQRHKRGEVSLPLGGGPDVLAAMYSKKQADGTYRGFAGDSYIALVRFGDNGVEIESVNAYGASSKPGTQHFTTQMEYFVAQQLKPMSLSKEAALKNAIRVYSPMKVVE